MGLFYKTKEYFNERKENFKDDLIAGFIVAIVALPLAIGFAIASDVTPAMGVYTAIIAGFVAAVFGGSEFQVSGPTGAMVVVILSVVHAYGIGGLILATLIAGVILILMGILKLGKIIEYIPSPVIVGFTAGIGVIIFFGQLNNFFGTSPVYPEEAEFFSKTLISLQHAVNFNIGAVILALITIALLVMIPRITRKVPGSIVAVTITTLAVFLFPSFFHVKTVGDIGTIPTGLSLPTIPHINLEIIMHLLPAALTIAALAAIESLLSAVVADGMTGTKHNPNKELFGQGFANIASALFGGMPATGAIARTATNIRNGAKSRFAAIFHAIFLLGMILIIAPLATKIPLAALAGILMFVAFNMIEWERIFLMIKMPLSEVTVMFVTFLLTVFIDLTTAIEVGFILAAILFMKRMSSLYNIELMENQGEPDNAKDLIRNFRHPEISIYTINGPLFFGAASRFDQEFTSNLGGQKPIKIIRMKYVPVIDATGLYFLESTYKKHRKKGGVVLFSKVQPDVLKIIKDTGLYEEIGKEHFFNSTREALKHALRHAHKFHEENESVTEEELAKYNISKSDFEEENEVEINTEDVDPVEEMLEGVGIKKVTRVTKKGMTHAASITKNGITGATKATKKGIAEATKITKKGINNAAKITKYGIGGVAKAVTNIKTSTNAKKHSKSKIKRE